MAVNTFSTIYVLTNFGATWRATTAPDQEWVPVSSAHGTRLVACAFRASIYTSTNSGATWIETSTPGGYWESLASTADGGRSLAVLSGDSTGVKGALYGAYSIIPPCLDISLFDTNVILSWTVPSVSFVLQQNPQPMNENWADVDAPPALFRLQQGVVLKPGLDRIFYRLRRL